jgi:hypothetical protein
MWFYITGYRIFVAARGVQFMVACSVEDALRGDGVAEGLKHDELVTQLRFSLHQSVT